MEEVHNIFELPDLVAPLFIMLDIQTIIRLNLDYKDVIHK